MFKKIITFFTVSFLLGCLYGCASKKTVALAQMTVDYESNTVDETKDFIPDSEHVKALGRTLFIDDMLLLGYSCTGAEFNVKAKRLDITIAGDNKANMVVDNGSAARIVVFVDGERKLDEMILSQSQQVRPPSHTRGIFYASSYQRFPNTHQTLQMLHRVP